MKRGLRCLFVSEMTCPSAWAWMSLLFLFLGLLLFILIRSEEKQVVSACFKLKTEYFKKLNVRPDFLESGICQLYMLDFKISALTFNFFLIYVPTSARLAMKKWLKFFGQFSPTVIIQQIVK
jgi:hypothetical protein